MDVVIEWRTFLPGRQPIRRVTRNVGSQPCHPPEVSMCNTTEIEAIAHFIPCVPIHVHLPSDLHCTIVTQSATHFAFF